VTRRVSKHGTAYTEGSSQTPAEDMPRVCASCGERIYTSRQGFQAHTERGTTQAWHVACPPPWRKAA